MKTAIAIILLFQTKCQFVVLVTIHMHMHHSSVQPFVVPSRYQKTPHCSLGKVTCPGTRYIYNHCWIQIPSPTVGKQSLATFKIFFYPYPCLWHANAVCAASSFHSIPQMTVGNRELCPPLHTELFSLSRRNLWLAVDSHVSGEWPIIVILLMW